MPKLKPGQRPKYRLHKHSGKAVVGLDGDDKYLGPYGSDESWSAYYRLTDAWLARQASSPPQASLEPVSLLDRPQFVGEVILRFDEWAKRYYVTDGELSREYTNIQHALRHLIALYGTRPINDLDITAFEGVQESMVRSNLTRKVVNDRMRRIRMVIRWAAARKLLPAEIAMACDGVKALRPKRFGVKEV